MRIITPTHFLNATEKAMPSLSLVLTDNPIPSSKTDGAPLKFFLGDVPASDAAAGYDGNPSVEVFVRGIPAVSDVTLSCVSLAHYHSFRDEPRLARLQSTQHS
jgi:hypothetical protein